MDNLEIFIDKVHLTLTNFRNKGLLVYSWKEPASEPCVESMYDTFYKDPTSDDPERLQRLLHYRREFPLLWETGNDPETRKNFLKWIVCNWGGINNIKDDTLYQYIPDLPIESYSTSNYLKTHTSSFSKCLAFIHPKICYVYDSRVALALNCLSHIHNLQDSIVFKQTSSKSYYTTEVSRIINKKVSRRTKRIDYFGYCQIVRRLAGLDENNDENYIKAHKFEAELFMLGGWIRDQMKPLIPPNDKDKKIKLDEPTYNVLDKHLRSLF